MSARKPILLLVAVAASVAAYYCLKQSFAVARKEMPSYQRAHGSVAQILFVQGRTLVRNELSELFASDDNGRTWRTLSEEPESLSIAHGNEIWGAHGWPGHHEGPSASVWYTRDRGETWATTDLELPDKLDKALYSRLPAVFINEPGDAPLLLMSDSQLVRPALAADSSTWQRVGRRIDGPANSHGTINRSASGCAHGGSIYVASLGTIYFSSDNGMTWAHQDDHRFHDAPIRCREATCFALPSEVGSAWSGLMSTSADRNDWKLVRTFGAEEVTRVLTADGRHPTVTTFAATALLPTAAGTYVAGIVDAGQNAWGAVLLVANDGAITSVGHGVPTGLWVLEQAPDGTVWAGGQGAYRLAAGEWVPAWSAPKL